MRDDNIVRLAEAARPRAVAGGMRAGETGKPLAVLANALVVLRAVMPDTFAFDEMLRAPLLMQRARGRAGFHAAPGDGR